MEKIRYSLEIKGGVNTMCSLAGRIDVVLTTDELQKIIETEQFLEKLTGFRFHINSFVPTQNLKSGEFKTPQQHL